MASNAKEFVKSIDLSGIPRKILPQDAATEAGEVFDQAKSQAQVVASGVFSFAQGVTAEVREAISNSALLAQLKANKEVHFEVAPLDWIKSYFDVLQNLGWTVQDNGCVDYSAQGTALEVHEKILEVMTVALGPTPAALAIITATVNALKAMQPDSSWITLFNRESQSATIARFQIGLVEKGPTDDVFVSLVCCVIEAATAITQVLFFKFRNAGASFKADSARVSVNPTALTELGPIIRGKVRAYITDYVSSIQDV